MGCRKKPTLYRLKFEDYDGLEITTRSVPLKDFLEINKMALLSSRVETDPQKQSEQAERQFEQAEGMFRKFSKALLDWNLEDEEGKPVPATHAGLMTQEMALVNEIIKL